MDPDFRQDDEPGLIPYAIALASSYLRLSYRLRRSYGQDMTTTTDPSSEAQMASEAIPHQDPFALFDVWFADARAAEPNDGNAMALATATPDGRPSVRMVLLKGHG